MGKILKFVLESFWEKILTLFRIRVMSFSQEIKAPEFFCQKKLAEIFLEIYFIIFPGNFRKFFLTFFPRKKVPNYFERKNRDKFFLEIYVRMFRKNSQNLFRKKILNFFGIRILED
jgi:hypothetical protein